MSIHALLLLLFIFPATVFPALVQKADNKGRAAVISHCGGLLQGHTLAPLAPNRTVVSLLVQDDLADYLVRLSVGDPPRDYTLSIDTGSATVFLGAKGYVKTISSRNTTQPMIQKYLGNQGFQGFEFFDNVTLGDCVWLNQSIGIPHTLSDDLKKLDGVLGIGPTRLTQGSLFSDVSIPTITDNLALNVIPSKTLALSFRPWNESNQLNSEITWGGIDQSKFVGPLIYVPITKTMPAGRYMGINASIFYDNKPLLSNGAGFIDSGSTPLYLADDVFDSYAKASNVVKGSWSSITSDNYQNLKPLVFVIGNSSFPLTPDGQRYPPSVGRKYFQLNPSNLSILINSTGQRSGNGNDFILGMPWLRRFYVVYDSDNELVGVANTSYTDATFN